MFQDVKVDVLSKVNLDLLLNNVATFEQADPDYMNKLRIDFKECSARAKVDVDKLGTGPTLLKVASLNPKLTEREFFIDNLLVRIHFFIVMIRWTGLAPWEFKFPLRGSLI